MGGEKANGAGAGRQWERPGDLRCPRAVPADIQGDQLPPAERHGPRRDGRRGGRLRRRATGGRSAGGGGPSTLVWPGLARGVAGAHRTPTRRRLERRGQFVLKLHGGRCGGGIREAVRGTVGAR